MTKFCKDCKYYNSFPDAPYCSHELSKGKPDMVSGVYFYKTCGSMRVLRCGEKAQYFEPKKQLTPPPTSETIKTRSYDWFKTFWK